MCLYFSSLTISFVSQNCIFFPPSYRLHPSRLKGPLLHRPVWAGASEASCGKPAAVCRPLLQGRQPHPEEWRCQAPAGPRCCHSGAGPAWTLHHGPGETGHWEGPSKKASANGMRDFWILFIFNFRGSKEIVVGIHYDNYTQKLIPFSFMGIKLLLCRHHILELFIYWILYWYYILYWIFPACSDLFFLSVWEVSSF